MTINSSKATAASAGITHTLGTLGLGAFTLSVAPGANVASGTAGVAFGATALSGNATVSPGTNSSLSLGAVTGAFTLTVGGTGTTILTATGNSPTNGFIINSGATLNITTNNAIGTPVPITVNGTLNNSAGEIFGVLNGSGTINQISNFHYTRSTANGTFSGIITGAGGYIKDNTGIQTLTGLSTFTGTTTIGSTAAGGALVVNSLNYVTSGSWANHLVGSALGMPTTAANGTIAIGATTFGSQLTYNGAGETTDRVINLAGTTGGAIIDQSGASGTLRFTSAFTATGVGAKTLTLQGSTAGVGEIDLAIPNSSSGATSLTKTGTGTWILDGANTYTGATTLTQGTLQFNGINTGVSAVTVQGAAGNNATLGGTGTIPVLSPSRLAPPLRARPSILVQSAGPEPSRCRVPPASLPPDSLG